MSRRMEFRLDPKRLWAGVESVIVAGINYAPPLNHRSNPADDRVLRISRYAWNMDYHPVVIDRLKRAGDWMSAAYGGKYKAYTDTGPVMEKALASAAGIGSQGKNTLAVSPEFGPWLFLGVILTDLKIDPDEPADDTCGECSACIDRCPGSAITAPYRMDPRKCIAYLTIEHKGAVPEPMRETIGNRVYGCDDCITACPKGGDTPPSEEPAFVPLPDRIGPDPFMLLRLDKKAFNAHFSGSPIKRIGVNKFLSNLLICLGNCRRTDCREMIVPLRRHDSAVVRESALWALSRFDG